MNATYLQNKNVNANSSNSTKMLVSRIGSCILAALIFVMIFLPIVSTPLFSISSFDLVKIVIGLSSESSYLFGTDISMGVSATVCVLLVLLILSSIGILIFNLIKYRKPLKILALLLSIIHTLVSIAIIICALLASIVPGVSIGFGIIIQLLLSITEIVFTALGISAAPARAVPHYPIPPQTNPPRPVPPQPVSQKPDSPDDDGVTIAQKGAIEGIKGEYMYAKINIMPGESIIIGRDPKSSNIVIKSGTVSRKHCVIAYDSYNNCYNVTDLSSQNGTFANKQRLPKEEIVQLSSDTMLSIGSEENMFKLL